MLAFAGAHCTEAHTMAIQKTRHSVGHFPVVQCMRETGFVDKGDAHFVTDVVETRMWS